MATIKKVRRELIAREFRCGHKLKEPEPRAEVQARPALRAGKRKAGASIYVLAAYREHEGTARFPGWATQAEVKAVPVQDVGGMGSRVTSSTTHGGAHWSSCRVSRRPGQRPCSSGSLVATISI